MEQEREESRVRIQRQDMERVMKTALEGGIASWCSRARVNGKYIGRHGYDHVPNGGEMILRESEVRRDHRLTKDDLLRGIAMAVERGCHEGRQWFSLSDGCYALDPSRIDEDVANAIVQLAVFSEVVYS